MASTTSSKLISCNVRESTTAATAMIATLNKTPTRPQPIFSSKDLAKEYRSPYIRASGDAFGKILARAAIVKEGHLSERTFGRVCDGPFRAPRDWRVNRQRRVWNWQRPAGSVATS